jgi:hypothetical protein
MTETPIELDKHRGMAARHCRFLPFTAVKHAQSSLALCGRAVASEMVQPRSTIISHQAAPSPKLSSNRVYLIDSDTSP